MGIDVNGIIAYGINLTEDQVYDLDQNCEDGIYEKFDELFVSWPDSNPKYPNLEAVAFGSHEYPDWVIAIKVYYSDDWQASEFPQIGFTLDQKDIVLLKTLKEFCEDYDITYEPKWYFGGQYR